MSSQMIRRSRTENLEVVPEPILNIYNHLLQVNCFMILLCMMQQYLCYLLNNVLLKRLSKTGTDLSKLEFSMAL